MDNYSFIVYQAPGSFLWIHFWFAVAVIASITACYLVYVFFSYSKFASPGKNKIKATHKKAGIITGTIVSMGLIKEFPDGSASG